MKVINKVNKRIDKNTIRMFFELENDKKVVDYGKLLIEITLGFAKISNYSVQTKPIDGKQFGYVYFDIDRKVFKPEAKFTWAFESINGSAMGSDVLTDKFENLYEGIRGGIV